MGTCKRCGNRGLFLKVNEDGYCKSCEEIIKEAKYKKKEQSVKIPNITKRNYIINENQGAHSITTDEIDVLLYLDEAKCLLTFLNTIKNQGIKSLVVDSPQMYISVTADMYLQDLAIGMGNSLKAKENRIKLGQSYEQLVALYLYFIDAYTNTDFLYTDVVATRLLDKLSQAYDVFTQRLRDTGIGYSDSFGKEINSKRKTLQELQKSGVTAVNAQNGANNDRPNKRMYVIEGSSAVQSVTPRNVSIPFEMEEMMYLQKYFYLTKSQGLESLEFDSPQMFVKIPIEYYLDRISQAARELDGNKAEITLPFEEILDLYANYKKYYNGDDTIKTDPSATKLFNTLATYFVLISTLAGIRIRV